MNVGFACLSSIASTNAQGSPAVFLATQRSNGRLASLLGSHFDDADDTAFLLYVCNQSDPSNPPKGRAQFFEVRFVCGKIQITDANGHSHTHLSLQLTMAFMTILGAAFQFQAAARVGPL